MILTVIAIYVGLFIFENLPTSLIVGGLVAQVGPISSLAFKIKKNIKNILGRALGPAV